MIDMKVSNTFKTYDIYGAKKMSQSSRTGRAEEKRDSVALSSQAKDYQTISKILAETPDVREDVISGLKEKVASGSYVVSSGDIASKLIDKWAALE